MTPEQEVEKTINLEKEWLRYQYDPGHWLTNIPPFMLRKNRKLGFLLFIGGIAGLLFNIWLFSETKISFLFGQQVIFTIMSVLSIFAGYTKLKEK